MIDNDTVEKWADAATREALSWMKTAVCLKTLCHFVSHGTQSVLPSTLSPADREYAEASISNTVFDRIVRAGRLRQSAE